MRPFPVHILAEDHVFYEGECLSLNLPFPDGLYGIQAGHSNVLSAVAAGELNCLCPDGSSISAAVSGGIAKVENGEVLVLVESAERPEEIDAARAKRAAEAARDAMLAKRSSLEYRTAQANLIRATNRLRVKNRRKFINDK